MRDQANRAFAKYQESQRVWPPLPNETYAASDRMILNWLLAYRLGLPFTSDDGAEPHQVTPFWRSPWRFIRRCVGKRRS